MFLSGPGDPDPLGPGSPTPRPSRETPGPRPPFPTPGVGPSGASPGDSRQRPPAPPESFPSSLPFLPLLPTPLPPRLPSPDPSGASPRAARSPPLRSRPPSPSPGQSRVSPGAARPARALLLPPPFLQVIPAGHPAFLPAGRRSPALQPVWSRGLGLFLVILPPGGRSLLKESGMALKLCALGWGPPPLVSPTLGFAVSLALSAWCCIIGLFPRLILSPNYMGNPEGQGFSFRVRVVFFVCF